MVRVKICGLTRKEDIDICTDAGVHSLGFVVEYPLPVPWNLTSEAAAELIHAVPPFVSRCIVTAGSKTHVFGLAARLKPDIIQLHGEETLEETAEIAAELRKIGIQCIRALRVTSKGELLFSIARPTEAAEKLSHTDVSALLVDSVTEELPGGTGVPADMRVYDAIRASTALPVILGGGLTPGNLKEILSGRQPYAIDVLSGVEQTQGIKDKTKIHLLMKAAMSL